LHTSQKYIVSSESRCRKQGLVKHIGEIATSMTHQRFGIHARGGTFRDIPICMGRYNACMRQMDRGAYLLQRNQSRMITTVKGREEAIHLEGSVERDT
jgi:hypothetical protein